MDTLKEHGLKKTSPRMRILRIFEEETEGHLSAEEIYERLKRVGEEVNLATIYRVLAQFEASGLIIRHYFEGEHAVFELRDESPHDHLICLACSAVQEFIDPSLENKQKEIAAQFGFQSTAHLFYIYGYCHSCHGNT